MSESLNDIRGRLSKEVLVLDGAMGTMIQQFNLTSEDFRGNLPIPSHINPKGANDLLCLTHPEIIADIHSRYVNAGADIIETCSFNANAVSMAEYGAEALVGDINRAAAEIARSVADNAGRKVYVAGSMGPSNVALSIGGDSSGVDFEKMAESFREQAVALIEGGVDLLMLETAFDTLNAKAGIAGIMDAFSQTGKKLPLMISATLTEQGRTLSGQTLKAFVNSVRHADPIAIGLNCGFGADALGEMIEELQDIPYAVSMHPNAGLPDELGRYTQTPEMMAEALRPMLKSGKLNIVGGCCGTTPDHIRAIAEIVKGEAAEAAPRVIPASQSGVMHLSGLLPLDLSEESGFLKVGERCNVAGSRKFLRLIGEGNASEAMEIAIAQVKKGAGILDINMDDGMLDAPEEMERFVMLLGAEVATSSLPLMIDSSDMEVVRRALRRIQGRPIVNSISLKEGETKFLAHAAEIRRLGGTVVVMAFDEKGQAADFERRIEICQRAYRLLLENGWKAEEIIFDPNILTIATGMPEHDRYALDFLEAVEWIKKNLPGAKVSGGVSNLSFSFRGINRLREAMHTVFLHHASLRGMDMAIVNPSSSLDIDSVPVDLREKIEDVIFCRREDAVSRLLEEAGRMREEDEAKKRAKAAAAGAATSPVAPPKAKLKDTLEHLVEKGLDTNLDALLDEALAEEGSAMGVVKNRLMAAMQNVGDEFGAGRMFLPQVVRSAAVMKKAIEYLTPVIEKETANAEGSAGGNVGEDSGEKKFVLATVKGDVHDIGKNIVGVVLRCSGFEVIDLGVMVEPSKIIETLKATGAKFLGLSGLITPSLAEMCNVAELLEKEGMTDVTICVGGATTSPLHTAVKIAPVYSGIVLHTRDAAALPVAAAELADKLTAGDARKRIADSQEALRGEYEEKKRKSVTPSAEKSGGVAGCPCCSGQHHSDAGSRVMPVPAPKNPGINDFEIAIADVRDFINFKAFLHVWQISPTMRKSVASEESEKLIADANLKLDALEKIGLKLLARIALLPAYSKGDDIYIRYQDKEGNSNELLFPTIRQEGEHGVAVADFIAPENDWLGLFCVTAGEMLQAAEKAGLCDDDYHRLLVQSLADRLAEAATEYIHTITHDDLWQLETPRGIRPAIGYPSIPDQTLVFEADKILDYASMGVQLTENGALRPSATTTGLIIASPAARYFDIPHLSEATLQDYARRRGLPVERLQALLSTKI